MHNQWTRNIYCITRDAQSSPHKVSGQQPKDSWPSNMKNRSAAFCHCRCLVSKKETQRSADITITLCRVDSPSVASEGGNDTKRNKNKKNRSTTKRMKPLLYISM